MMLPQLIVAQITVPHVAAFQFEPWAQVVIERVINSMPEGLLIALFAWAVLRVLPRQNSRTRFAVWFTALMAMAGVPLVDGLNLGSFTLAGLNSRILAPSRFATGGATSAIALPAHWAPFILLVWLVIVCGALTRLAMSLWHLGALRLTCTPVDTAALEPSLTATVAELNGAGSRASRSVTIATSETLRVPAALGLWKPMIVLPSWTLRELPPHELSIILRHEFAHLRRWDDWTNLLQKIVRALFFFHPAVWWIENRLSVEREMACDDVVVAQTDNPMGYARCLVSLLERSLAQRGWTMAQAIVHRAREASLRLTRILDKDRPASTRISKPTLGLVGAFAVLCITMLPQTPELVAFDRGPLPADQSYSAALTESPVLNPSMIHKANLQISTPASVRPERSSEREPALQRPIKLQIRPSSGEHAPSALENRQSSRMKPEVLAHTLLPAASRGMVRDSSASESFIRVNVTDQNQPLVQTLVFVEATEFITTQEANSNETTATPTLWRVQVWRVTVFNSAWERSTRVPIANKT